ncbi:TetR/AcrR family transcriptional regulator [Yoonia sp.]|uniref:TetR/AcrR family transcriptional regulator n=1 Tax=Yoonia sp. TaxID=2212373 RepID=UPI00391D812D
MGKSDRNLGTAEAILQAAERLFAQRGFGAVSLREIAREAAVSVSSIGYHFTDRIGLLAAIYARHTEPMNARRRELLGEALRTDDLSARLTAILRAYLLPAFTSSATTGDGARFTRLRAVMSAEGDLEARRIIAESFDDTTRAFLDAIAGCLPGADREDIVWRSQFLLGALYYTLINPERIDRLSDGHASGADHGAAIDALVSATHASLIALTPPREA